MLDSIAEAYKFHYEIGAGTALGTVKLSNFIPWDIDADTHVNQEIFMKYFAKEGAAGSKAFDAAGIKGSLHLVINNYIDTHQLIKSIIS